MGDAENLRRKNLGSKEGYIITKRGKKGRGTEEIVKMELLWGCGR